MGSEEVKTEVDAPKTISPLEQNAPETISPLEQNAPETISPLEQKIIRQIEYYFGDVNLPRDKFLKEKIQEDDGWITLECLTTFNRLKMLSTDLMEIANALKKSKANLLEVHEDNLKVRRSVDKPIPDVGDPMLRKASKMKTLYMKGFSESFQLDDVESFLNKQGVQSVFVKLRKTDDQKFKGSIFVELQTQEDADKLLNATDLKCGETVLVVKTRDDYFKSKQEERQNQKDTDEKIRKEHEECKLPRKPGSVLHFKDTGEDTSREHLKSLFGKHEPVAWVDFNRGETEGFIRFQEEGAAQRAIDALKKENDGKILIGDVESTVRVIEGEESENYWKMTEDDMKKQRERGGRNRGRGRKGRGGGRGGGKDRNSIKRRRPWEDKKVDTATKDSDIKINEHKHFDCGDEDVKVKTDDANEAKKAKLENED